MNCVLHYLNKPEEVTILENNYDVLKEIIPNQYAMSFNVGVVPNRPLEQIFYRKLNNDNGEYLEYAKYFTLFQINKFLQNKNYKKLLFVNSDVGLKRSTGLLNLFNELNNRGSDCIRFNRDNQLCRSMFIMKIYNLDSNLDYANCSFEEYHSRQKYDSFDVYINSSFNQTHNIENYI